MKLRPVEIDGRSSELVEEHPRRLVAADPELALEGEGGEPALVRDEQVGRPEPDDERRPCPVEDRAGGRRGLSQRHHSRSGGHLFSCPGP